MLENICKEIKLVLGGGPGVLKITEERKKFEEEDMPNEVVLWNQGYFKSDDVTMEDTEGLIQM